MDPTRPRHLIHIGYTKAGATFFRAWCRSRADVAFDTDGIAGYAGARDVAELADARPALRVTSSERLVTGRGPREQAEALARRLNAGPAQPGRRPAQIDRHELVDRQERVCATLRELFPNAEILVLIRGYDTICRSMLSQGTKKGWGQAGPADAGRLLPLERWRVILDYDRVVRLYEEAFGPGRVSVLPYERLRDDVGAYVRALCRVGGVPHRPFDPGRVNASPGPHALGLIQRMSGVVHAGASALSEAGAIAVLRRYDRALNLVRNRPAFDALGRALGVAPFPARVFSDEELRAAFGGLAEAVARRPEVAPYAAHYTLEP